MFLSSALFFSKSSFSKNSFRNTTRVSNSLDPDQARRPNCLQRTSGLIWMQTVCKRYQQTTLGDKELTCKHNAQLSSGIRCCLLSRQYGFCPENVVCYLCLLHNIIEPVHEISNNVVSATSKASDQPAHRRSLIRAFVSRLGVL